METEQTEDVTGSILKDGQQQMHVFCGTILQLSIYSMIQFFTM
jgi:hypothetical protein